MTEYYIGQPVTVGRKYQSESVTGQGRFVTDEVSGNHLVTEINAHDLGLIRDTWEARALDVSDMAGDPDYWIHRCRILGDVQCTTLPTCDGSTPGQGPANVAVRDLWRRDEEAAASSSFESAFGDR